jgi:hypothetical protein
MLEQNLHAKAYAEERLRRGRRPNGIREPHAPQVFHGASSRTYAREYNAVGRSDNGRIARDCSLDPD